MTDGLREPAGNLPAAPICRGYLGDEPPDWKLRLFGGRLGAALQIVQPYEIVPESFRGRLLLDAMT